MKMSMRASMKNDGAWLGLVVLLGLAACPSDDPPGTDTDTGTDTGTNTTEPNPTTSVDTTETAGGSDCGNGMIDGEEECDGSELGGAECADVNPAYSGGTLACGASCTLDASGCELPPGTPLLALNEVTSEGVLAGDFMGLNDALELHNVGTGPADLSGWQVSDDMTLPSEKTYVIPEGTMLDPGDFMVLRSFDMLTMTGELPFGISDSMVETLVLADPAGGVVDSVAVDGYLARVSYCRVPDGNGPWFQCDQTFGDANQQADNACGNDVIEAPEQCDGADLAGNTCESLGLGFSGGTLTCRPTCGLDADECTTDSELVINEVSATTDGIEIFNGSTASVDISGWVLTDDRVLADYDVALDLEELVFDEDTVLAPGEYLVVPPGLGPNQHPFGLGVMGDTIALVDPASPLTIIDQVTYGDGQATISYCRQPNGPDGEFTPGCAATMGGPN
jgi:hypothetical protein